LPINSVKGLVAGANSEREARAAQVVEKQLAAAKRAGVSANSRIMHASYTAARNQLVRLARIHDLTIMQRSHGPLSLEKDLAEECLFNSGRPAIIVPPDGKRGFGLKRIAIAWDGGARAARAVGDAMQLLAAAETVAIITVSGDRADKTLIPGAEIAEHLSRHCGAVTLEEVASKDGDIAKALITSAEKADADLLVMGSYGHARFREMLLGGVTQSLLSHAPLPLFTAS
jgi:nucleotide-binding universal stress UspA family protein